MATGSCHPSTAQYVACLCFCTLFGTITCISNRYCVGSSTWAEDTSAPLASGSPAEPLQISNDAFVRVNDGQQVQIKAISWLASATAQSSNDSMHHNLWVTGNIPIESYASIAYQTKLSGFTGLRLPFTFKSLKSNKTHGINTTLQQVNSVSQSARLVDSQSQPWASSSLSHYLWAIHWFVANGLYVILDCHLQPAASRHAGDAELTSEAFTNNWKWLWTAVTCLPSFSSDLQGRVFISLLSQPLPVVMRWEDQTGSQGHRVPGLTTLYLSAMDELEQLLPNGTLYFVEGGDQQQQDSITTPEWGDGFVINAGIISRNNWSDPNPFFRALLKRQFRGRVVLVPHIASLPSPPGELTAGEGAAVKEDHEHVKLVDTSFTYLAKHGFCLASGDCQRFPMAFRDMRMGQAISDDLQQFVAYLEQEGVGAETSEAVGSWYFWKFNGSAMQTGNRTSMRL